VQEIPPLVVLDHGRPGFRGPLDAKYRLMPVRIESLSHGSESSQSPAALEGLQELLLDHAHSLEKGVEVARLLGRPDRPLEIVDRGDDVGQQGSVRVSRRLVPLANHPFPEVLEVGLLAQELVPQVERFGLERQQAVRG
jgi:hypothetical protein